MALHHAQYLVYFLVILYGFALFHRLWQPLLSFKQAGYIPILSSAGQS